jgi:hypothetical protein
MPVAEEIQVSVVVLENGEQTEAARPGHDCRSTDGKRATPNSPITILDSYAVSIDTAILPNGQGWPGSLSQSERTKPVAVPTATGHKPQMPRSVSETLQSCPGATE